MPSPKPWSAIVRGAALRGLEGSKVPVHKCRRHYGFTIDRKFDPSLDNDDDDSIYEDEVTGRKMVKHCMEWIFTKNEEIVPNTKKRMYFSQHYYPRRGKDTAELKIYFCNLSTAPKKKGTQTKLLGTIQVNMEDINLRQCECHKTKKGIYYRISFTAIVTLGSDEGIMQVAVEWEGKQCGSGRLKFPDNEVDRLADITSRVALEKFY